MADDDLLTRPEVAAKFGVYSVAVRNWARNAGVALTEVEDDDGNPRYRRAEVDALFASGFPWAEADAAAADVLAGGEELLTRDEVAELFDVEPATVEGWIDRKVPC